MAALAFTAVIRGSPVVSGRQSTRRESRPRAIIRSSVETEELRVCRRDFKVDIPIARADESTRARGYTINHTPSFVSERSPPPRPSPPIVGV